jgi:hypothetical protein
MLTPVGAKTVSFEIPTSDRLGNLTGQLDFPTGQPRGAVLIVPGGWFMDRDGFMGGCDDPRCLLYRELAKDLCAAGLLVARYDNRGVRGNEFRMPPWQATDELQRTREYLAHCVVAEQRKAVTPETVQADVLSVYRWLRETMKLEEAELALVAHSEGGLHVARLVARQAIAPAGIAMIGVITESPQSILRWQMIDRYVDHLMQWDSDRDGVVTAEEIVAGCERSALLVEAGVSLDPLTAQPRWTADQLREHFRSLYDTAREEALAADPAAPYPAPAPELEMVAYAYRWWQSWFTDDRPVCLDFADYPGEVVFHLGEIDSQAPGRRQVERAEQLGSDYLRVQLHEGRGHALRSGEPATGPIDPAAKTLVVADLLRVFG